MFGRNRRLSIRERGSVAVDFGEQAIANKASLVHLNFFERLSEQRLDRVPPELKNAHGHRSRVYVSKSGA
jgi:hypothetical protein